VCTLFSGNLLVLPNGDSVYLPCPISGDATLTELSKANLVEALPKGMTFASGLNLQVAPKASLFSAGEETSDLTGATMTISFVIPANQLNSEWIMLYWNGSKWEDINAVVVNGHLNAQVDFDGTFVMVSK
jgi:hypothetical protein